VTVGDVVGGRQAVHAHADDSDVVTCREIETSAQAWPPVLDEAIMEQSEGRVARRRSCRPAQRLHHHPRAPDPCIAARPVVNVNRITLYHNFSPNQRSSPDPAQGGLAPATELPEREHVSSLNDVARESGVSVATASRVLNPANSHPVGAATRDRVLKVAAELNYSSNGVARELRTRRLRTVGVIVHDIRDPYFSECTRGITDAASAAGYLTMICNTDRDPETELRYVRLLSEQRVAGVLFVGAGLVDPSYAQEVRRLVRAIRAYGGEVVALGPRSDPWIAEVPDNRGGAQLATEHLIALGHEQIAFIDGPAKLKTNEERIAGYRNALSAAGLTFNEALVIAGQYTADGGAEATKQLLDSSLEFTAIFASNDQMALGSLVAIHERGLRVPRDVSLVGFDDLPFVRWLRPSLTTVAVPMLEIGAAGMRRLIAATSQDDGTTPSRKRRRVNVHSVKLIIRGSTGPPSQTLKRALVTRDSTISGKY